MSRIHAKIAFPLSLAGAAICVAAMVRFMLSIVHNDLAVSTEQPLRDLYQAVGQSYGQGFIVGFFLCFFLAIAAVTVASLYERHVRDLLQRSSLTVRR